MNDDQAAGSAEMDGALAVRRKRALYRAQYRGTKEMDWMVGRYASAKLAAMTADELTIFEAFLEVGDPEINAWLMAEAECGEAMFLALIADMRAFHTLV